MDTSNSATDPRTLYEQKGRRAYTESVCQIEHALQCAWLAEKESGDAELITAAMLHDIGHLLQKVGQDAALRGIDDKHQDIAGGWLKHRFTDRVVNAVRLHVEAKRYLCATRPDYFATLSVASVRSLALQGGPMNEAEVSIFEGHAHWQDAVRLREWDDRGKVNGLETPDWDHFHHYLEKSAAA